MILIRAAAAAISAMSVLWAGAGTVHAGAVEVVLAKRTAAWNFRLTAGDREFFGHGPSVTATVSLSVSSDGRMLLATMNGKAKETQGGDTRAAATGSIPLLTVPVGNKIEAILSRKTSTVSYVDGDHEADWLCETAGEIKLTNRKLYRPRFGKAPCLDGLTYAVRVVGDTDGQDVAKAVGFTPVRRSHVQVFFNPIRLKLTKALPGTFWGGKELAVPGESWYAENTEAGENGCSASAGHRLLRYYGVAISYETMRKRIRSRFHATNILNLGVPPGMLRDALNERKPGFKIERLTKSNDTDIVQTNDAIRSVVKSRMRALLDAGKPFIALIAWGSQTAYTGRDRPTPVTAKESYHGLSSPQKDEASFSAMHYVVVSGYNAKLDTFTVVDNGRKSTWTSEFLLNVMLFDKGLDMDIALGIVASDVQPATVIHR